MQTLFCLKFYDEIGDAHCEQFHIGLFSSYEEAVTIATYYRNEVPGFKDYECRSEISPIPVVGVFAGEHFVYRYQGWNEDDNHDEIDIIESVCYLEYRQAEEDYRKAQIDYDRQEWTLNRYTIGQCYWQEGFDRYT